MQAIKTKMMVGDLVMVPDRVFMACVISAVWHESSESSDTTPDVQAKTSTSQLLLMVRHPKS